MNLTPAETSSATDAPPWTWRDIGQIVAATLLGAILLFALLPLVLGGPEQREEGLAAPAAFVAMASLYGLLLLSIYLIVARRVGWAALGLVPLPARTFAFLPLVLLAQIGGLILINGLIGVLMGSFENPQAGALTGGEPLEPLQLGLLLVLIAGLVPLAEEIFFRGLVYPLLRARGGVVLAVGVSAALFAVVHFIPVLMPALFYIGLLFGIVREQTRSIVPCVILHGLQNGLALLAINMQLAAPQ